MTFEYKDVVIESHNFKFKFLTSVESRQLDKSNGQIAIGVFYTPTFPTSMREAELVIEKYSLNLRREIDLIISENLEFYKMFKPEDRFKRFGSSGGVNIYGQIVSENSTALLLLNKIVI